MGKLSNYFIENLFVSVIRITSYLLFYIGLILRFTYASTDEELGIIHKGRLRKGGRKDSVKTEHLQIEGRKC